MSVLAEVEPTGGQWVGLGDGGAPHPQHPPSSASACWRGFSELLGVSKGVRMVFGRKVLALFIGTVLTELPDKSLNKG